MGRGKTIRVLLLAGLVFSSVFGYWALSQGKAAPKLYRQSQFLLDTLIEIMVFASDEHDAHTAISAAYTEIGRIESLLSRYSPESQISLVNQSAGKEQFPSVAHEVFAIVQRSLDYAVMTDGLFDMTIGPVIDAWSIGTPRERIPDQAELHQLLHLVDYRKIVMKSEQGIRLPEPGMALDLGGIAKGYAIDQAIAILREHGVIMALVNAGGDIRCLGTKADGTPWRVGIQHPREKTEISGVVSLRDAAVATSGDYERYFLQQGIRYHHIIDPGTGMPARACQSVTIVAQTAEQADVLATAVFVMGPERGLAFLNEHPGIEGMIVRADGEFLFSNGFAFQPQ
ncbi:MAG: FAD:protein FMN transferase [Candidatus Vecturithrix sp.]|nr:FAD:protein FMN transferase [Candidatus Vecturithrix sp.]